METKTVALITTGRSNPSLSPTVAFFITRYSDTQPETKLFAYRDGFRGLLFGVKMEIGPQERKAASLIVRKAGAPLGGSRIRLTNIPHLQLRNLIKPDENPFDKAARQLLKDRVNVLHVVGSTNALQTAYRLSKILEEQHGWNMVIVAVPKTIENDIHPIRQSLGGMTAAEQGALFFQNIVPEHNANPRMLIIHEIKGRAAGWLCAETAYQYRQLLDKMQFASPELGLGRESVEIHAIYTPEMDVDFGVEFIRLKRVMDRFDAVNIFVAQGAFAEVIERESIEQGKHLEKHELMGYTKTDPSEWLAKKLKAPLGAEKVNIQKSGIFVRSAPSGKRDIALAQSMVDYAVEAASKHLSGVVGHDEIHGGMLRVIEIPRISSARKFDLTTPWFVSMMREIGQPQPILLQKKDSVPISLMARL